MESVNGPGMIPYINRKCLVYPYWCLVLLSTGWGPQSIAFSCLISRSILWFMVDITIVNGGFNGIQTNL